MRRRSRRHFARRRLRAGLSQASGRGAVGGALLAHVAAGRHLHREHYFVRSVWRRRGCRAGVGRGAKGRRPRNTGDEIRSSIPIPSTSWAGIFPRKASASCCRAKFRKWWSSIWPPTWTRSSKNKACRGPDIGTWVLHTGGPRVLEATATALELPEGALASVLGLPAPNRQSFVGIGAVGAGRSDDQAAAGAWDVQHPGRDGSWLLFRACVIEVVV